MEVIQVSKPMMLEKLEWMITYFKEKGFRVYVQQKRLFQYILFRTVDDEDRQWRNYVQERDLIYNIEDKSPTELKEV